MLFYWCFYDVFLCLCKESVRRVKVSEKYSIGCIKLICLLVRCLSLEEMWLIVKRLIFILRLVYIVMYFF